MALLGALALAAGLLGLSARTAQASSVLPPAADPFYVAPGNLASAAPGTVLRSRAVSVSLGVGVEAEGKSVPLAAVPLSSERFMAYQLLYRTNSATGQPVANVTTVMVPEGAAPTGGRKLVSLQDAEDSLDADCAPSYQLQVGEQAPKRRQQLGPGARDVGGHELAGSWLRPRRPGRRGTRLQWVVKGMAAHTVLDSIRAAERFGPAELGGAKTQVGLFGYSGGGFESAAADELQRAYAPKLNIVGVAAGGVPPANEQNLDWLNNSLVVGYAIGAAVGIDQAYPQMGLYSLLNATGQAVAKQVSAGCDTPGDTDPYANFNSWMTVPTRSSCRRSSRSSPRTSSGTRSPEPRPSTTT